MSDAVSQVRIYARAGSGGNGMGIVVDGVMIIKKESLLALAHRKASTTGPRWTSPPPSTPG